MATISYKCDTCKRKVELVENPQGFTVVGKCVITNGCTGRLYKTERNPNNVRESSPSYVEGLNNYVPRRAFHEFAQTLSSDKWKVVHDMGVFPSTFVYLLQPDGSYVQQDNSSYTVKSVDKNTISITFPSKVRGIVQCVAKSTVPLVPSTIPVSEALFQVSTNGVITFAVPKFLTQTHGAIPPVSPPAITPTLTPSPTPSSTPYSLPLNLCAATSVIQIEIEITKPNEDPFVCFEDVPNFTDNRSPWTGWGELLVSNRRNYCMRTVSLLKLNVFGNADLKASDIPNGTRIRFLRIDYGTGRKEEIPSRGLLMLLSKSPYENVDKIKDRIVDIGELIGDTPDYFVYRDGELFLDESKVEKTYPDIARVIFRPAPPAPSPTVTPTFTPTVTPTISVSPTPGASLTPTPSSSLTPTPTMSDTPTPTPTVSDTPTVTPTPTTTPAVTQTPTPTMTVTPTPASGPFAKWSTIDRSTDTLLSDDDTSIEFLDDTIGTATVYNSFYADTALTGKKYWEVTIDWTGLSSLPGNFIGISAAGWPLEDDTLYIGAASSGATILSNEGQIYSNGIVVFTAPVPGDLVTYTFAFDAVTLDLWVGDTVNGWYNGGDPEIGAFPILNMVTMDDYYPAGTINKDSDIIQIHLNAGQEAFIGSVPSGFDAGIIA